MFLTFYVPITRQVNKWNPMFQFHNEQSPGYGCKTILWFWFQCRAVETPSVLNWAKFWW